MATEKLSKAEIKQLKEIGINGLKTKDEAMKKMAKILKAEDIELDKDDTFEEAYEMAAVFYEDSEAEQDDLADEVAEDDAEEEEETEEEEEEEDEDFEEEVKEDLKKSKSKSKPAKPAAKKTVAKKSAKRLDPKNNEEDAKKYAPLVKVVKALSPKDEFDFNFIANGGVTVKYLGDNSKRAFFSFDSPKLKDDTILARVYIPSIKDEEKIKEIFGEDYVIKADWSGNFLVHDVELSDLVSLMTESKEKFVEILNTLGKKDEKLGKNRQKMEDELKSANKEKAEKIVLKKGKGKKKAKVEEVEEEEEPVKPKKKAKKADKVEVKPKKASSAKKSSKGTKKSSKS